MKMPPVQKLYEAFSAIADKRIIIKDEEALITSSNYQKVYSVLWDEQVYKSNDNATFWQGYPGYPVIAVLILQNRLPYNEKVISYFKNIDWHKINEEHKADYDKALKHVLETLTLSSSEQKYIKEYEQSVYDELAKLSIEVKRNTKKVNKKSEDIQ